MGPRYCPSIEDKVVRFADKERHQFFLEPEGEGTVEAYVQGISTSLPASVQYDFYRSIRGFENVKIMRDAYAIEYDCINPLELYPTLETKKIKGLFCAGQMLRLRVLWRASTRLSNAAEWNKWFLPATTAI